MVEELVTYSAQDLADLDALMLFAECRALADKPEVGRPYDDYRPGLRGYPCGKHVIFYRVLSLAKVRIVRVLHEKMDFPRHL